MHRSVLNSIVIMLNRAQGEQRANNTSWPFDLRSSLIDTEHLPKVRNTVTTVTSLILQGETGSWAQSSDLCLLLGLFPQNRKNYNW